MVDKVRVNVSERNNSELRHTEEGQDTDYLECGGLAQPNNVLTLSGSADPSAGAGVAAGIGSTYKRNTNGSFWRKTGAGDTEWTESDTGTGSGPIDGGTSSSSYEGGSPIDGGSSSSTY